MSNTPSEFTAGLRALADLIDANPTLTLPSVNVSALDPKQLDAYVAAFAAAGVTHTDHNDDHARVVTGHLAGLRVPVTKVHPASMERYRLERQLLREQAEVIDQRFQATQVSA